jgi:hypothetical protein
MRLIDAGVDMFTDKNRLAMIYINPQNLPLIPPGSLLFAPSP